MNRAFRWTDVGFMNILSNVQVMLLFFFKMKSLEVRDFLNTTKIVVDRYILGGD